MKRQIPKAMLSHVFSLVKWISNILSSWPSSSSHSFILLSFFICFTKLMFDSLYGIFNIWYWMWMPNVNWFISRVHQNNALNNNHFLLWFLFQIPINFFCFIATIDYCIISLFIYSFNRCLVRSDDVCLWLAKTNKSDEYMQTNSETTLWR